MLDRLVNMLAGGGEAIGGHTEVSFVVCDGSRWYPAKAAVQST